MGDAYLQTKEEYLKTNPNVAMNMEFLNKNIGTALIKKEDGIYYHKNKELVKIPNQKRAQKAFQESIEGWHSSSVKFLLSKGEYQRAIESGQLTKEKASIIIKSAGLEVPKDIQE